MAAGRWRWEGLGFLGTPGDSTVPALGLAPSALCDVRDESCSRHHLASHPPLTGASPEVRLATRVPPWGRAGRTLLP